MFELTFLLLILISSYCSAMSLHQLSHWSILEIWLVVFFFFILRKSHIQQADPIPYESGIDLEPLAFLFLSSECWRKKHDNHTPFLCWKWHLSFSYTLSFFSYTMLDIFGLWLCRYMNCVIFQICMYNLHFQFMWA